jgi:predicted glycosyltransferase
MEANRHSSFPAFSDTDAGGKCRIALYSHDALGLGHMRRNHLIAQSLATSSLRASILLIAGAREASAFSLPRGVDCLTLPALNKEDNDRYEPRFLDVSAEKLIELRTATITAALEAFDPDVFLVDKVPRGVLGELDPVLELLRRRGRTLCLLGLRDVLDEPAATRREWRERGTDQAIRDYYHAVWIYGDVRVFDQIHEYGFCAEVAEKVCYTGYLARPRRSIFSEIDGAELLPVLGEPEQLFLCLVGGGQDGPNLAETFAHVDFPPGTSGVILTGPFMPVEVLERLYRLARHRPRLRVIKFVTDPDLLLSLADRVVAMGGYNTLCEVLSFEKPALIVPRVQPRQEQLVRAQRLKNLGLIDMLHPDELCPETLGEWLNRDLKPPRGVEQPVNLDGAVHLPRMLEEALAAHADGCGGNRSERVTCHGNY